MSALQHAIAAVTKTHNLNSSTVLALPLNGSLIDRSASAHTVTANGNAATSTTQSKFGGSSFHFDGTGDYLSTPDSADFDFGSGDFTIDFWVYMAADSASTGWTMFGQDDGGANFSPITVFCDPSRHIIAYSSSNGSSWDIFSGVDFGAATTPLTLNAWHHVAFTRNGTSFRCFIDGTQFGTTKTMTGTCLNSTRSLLIGNVFEGTTGAGGLNGYLQAYRVTKGVALWTATFSPPTMPLDF